MGQGSRGKPARNPQPAGVTTPPAHATRAGRHAFVACYAASGAAALIYEVTWTRLLTLHLGHTVAAVTTVLAAFMGGLAAGAWLADRRPPSSGRRLQTYATLEILVALIAIALPAALHAFQPALAWAYADGDAPARVATVRVTLALALLAVPAAAMGATFPIAAAWFSADDVRVASGTTRSAADTGLLYTANTFGAAAGAIGAGFWLLPSLGIRATTWVGVGLNGIAALGALCLARRDAGTGAAPESTSRAQSAATLQASGGGSRRPQPPTVQPRPGLACAAAGLSGFAGLVYEVAFTRLLAAVIGPTTYAFATMAASFISGIALGSAAGTHLARRVRQPALWLAGMLLVGALSASTAASYAASRLPLVVAADVAAPGATFHSVVARQAFEIAVLLLPLTLALGAAFPLALATASSGSVAAAGHDTARVYVANTLGAIAGALAAGFLLVPRLGLRTTFVSMSRVGTIGGALVAGAWILSRPQGTARRLGWVSGLTAVAGIVIMLADIPRWDRDLLSSGAYKYAPYIAAADAVDLEASLRAGRLEYYAEGAAATVSVRRLAGVRSLAIDGKIDASDAGDMLTQRLLGVLPVLMHRNPRELCVIGLGSGVTLASAMATGLVRRADVVEISPEVVEASELFSKENDHVLHSPAAHLIIGDGRSHLQLTKRRYDVIVSEPSNPWMAGVAALFTREFFEAARARLEPGGVLCQWAHTYDMSPDDLRSIARTFASVFPHGTIWLVGDGDVLFVGMLDSDIDAALANLAARSASVANALADVQVTPDAAAFDLLSLFAAGPAELARYADAAAMQTDDRMALEFSAPRRIYGRSTNENTAAILNLAGHGALPKTVAAVMRAADARSWKARGAMDLKAQAYNTAYASFRRAAALDDRDADALKGVSDAAGGANRQDEERTWLEGLARAEPGNAAVRVELSRVRAAARDYDGALAAASDAGRLAPEDPRPAEQFASVLADMNDGARLEPIADALVARFPGREDGRYFRATALLLRGRTDDAAAEARQLLTANPRSAKAQNLLGVACANAGRRDCARAAFEASVRLNPRDVSAYVNLGLIDLESANASSAAEYFAEALALDPASAGARSGLAQARVALVKP
jgi:spermidine synthase